LTFGDMLLGNITFLFLLFSMCDSLRASLYLRTSWRYTNDVIIFHY